MNRESSKGKEKAALDRVNARIEAEKDEDSTNLNLKKSESNSLLKTRSPPKGQIRSSASVSKPNKTPSNSDIPEYTKTERDPKPKIMKRPGGGIQSNQSNYMNKNTFRGSLMNANPAVKLSMKALGTGVASGANDFRPSLQNNYLSPPALFTEASNIEQVFMEDLRNKITEFNVDLNNEIATNHKLNAQCKEYADRLREITLQFDAFKSKHDSKVESLEQKIDSLKQQLKEEKDRRSEFEKDNRTLRTDLEKSQHLTAITTKQFEEIIRQEREKVAELKDNLR